MRLGFTGTSDPQRDEQLDALKVELLRREFGEFHHGVCINADENAHQIVLLFTRANIVLHPPNNKKAEAKVDKVPGRVVSRQPKPYLHRNHDIVDETDELVACPRNRLEQRRSGTWATIRYARKKGRPVTIIYPNGRIVREKNC